MTKTNKSPVAATRDTPDLVDKVVAAFRTLKMISFDPLKEIYFGYQTSALPTSLCWILGIVLSAVFFFHLDDRLLLLFHRRSVRPGYFRDFLGITSTFWAFLVWGYYRMGVRGRIRNKLEHVFLNAGLETRLKETPEFRWDFPLDEFTRKLRLRGRGLPLSSYVTAKEQLQTGLNVTITKLENPNGNRELVDIIYTTEKMPEFWQLESLLGYKNFSFPIGRSYRGEIKANFQDLPHLLTAGESGGGKSSFIRMLVTVILVNNQDVEIYFIDFKKGMENQIFEGYGNVHIVDDPQDAAAKMNEVKRLMDERMVNFKKIKALKLESYNRHPDRKGPREKRIIVVVDEIAELMPTVGGKANPAFSEINSILNRISRMGRAVGVNLVIGVQKPDAKNLDPTIKSNLSGVLCFPVTHFTQSTIVLGNNRAAELNPEYKGRAIWKRGTDMVEVQTPFLTEKEVEDARKTIAKHWGEPAPNDKAEAVAKVPTNTPAKTHEARRHTSQGSMALEAAELFSPEEVDLSKPGSMDSLQVDEKTFP